MTGEAPRQGAGAKPDPDGYEEIFRDVTRGAAAGPQRATRKVPYLQRMIGFACVTLVLWLLFGKGSPFASSTAVVEPDETEAATEIPRPWIASTSPAITETLWELGLVTHVVGRSPYCTRLPKAVPVVGDLRDFSAEHLALAAPDALFVQPPLAGVDPALRSFCEAKGIRLVERRIDSFAETRALVGDIAGVFATAPEAGAEGLAGRLADAEAAFTALAAQAPGSAREAMPRVLLVVSTEPFLAVGRESYLDELLGAAQLDNAVTGRGWVELSPEAIVALDVGAILGIAETARGAAAMRDALGRLPWKQGKAPPRAVGIVPELLTPSLVALRKRGEIRALYERASAGEPDVDAPDAGAAVPSSDAAPLSAPVGESADSAGRPESSP